MIFDQLVDEARERIEHVRPAINRLRELGIQKELHMRNSSNIVVTYPAKQDLDPAERSAVYLAKRERPNTLYVHVPFCTGICSYCDFARTAGAADDKRIPHYMQLLAREASLLREMFGGPVPVQSIYIGGGTPTLLTLPLLEGLFQTIKENFALVDGGEYTLEGSPETITVENIQLARSYGVNRVSMGVESFNDEILEAMRRRERVTTVFAALQNVRNAGITHIDIDLIRGYPGYSTNLVINDLEGVRAANTTSVTSYQYALKPKAIDKKRLTDLIYEQEEQLLFHSMFLAGMGRIGYQHQQPLVDWFLKDPKWAYQHQIQKWKGMINLLGLGLGAYGYIDGVQYINFESRRNYEEYLNAGMLPIEKAKALSPEEVMHRRAIFGMKSGVDRKEFVKDHGIDIMEAPFRKTLEQIAEAGGIDVTGNAVRLSSAGVLFADWIQMALYSDVYKEKEKMRLNRQIQVASSAA